MAFIVNGAVCIAIGAVDTVGLVRSVAQFACGVAFMARMERFVQIEAIMAPCAVVGAAVARIAVVVALMAFLGADIVVPACA